MSLADAVPADRHRVLAATFTERVEGVEDWQAPTPVESWVAVDVVDHLITWSRDFLAAGGITLLAGPSAADGPLVAWVHHAGEIQSLLDSPAADDGFTHPQIGTLPLGDAIDRFYTSDVFMHTWDLARASGQGHGLDHDFAATLLSGMEPMGDVLRSSGHYGPSVPVAADGDPVRRLVGFIGRDPDWAP